jgi:hypothetical protein
MSQAVLDQVDRCIYCGKDGPGLTNEHVIPMGLLPKNEPGLVLRDASCKDCRDITSGFERAVLRRLWLPARAGLGLRSYRKRNIPRVYPLTIVRNGRDENVLLPLGEYPATLQLLEYEPPVHLTHKPYAAGINVNGNVLIQVAGPRLNEVLMNHGSLTAKISATFEGNTYERLVLKVAYGFAVATIGLSNIAEAWVVPTILGQTDNVGMWLGCDGDKRLSLAYFHGMSIAIVGNEIHCRVRLFANFNTPEYLVIVGKVTHGTSLAAV